MATIGIRGRELLGGFAPQFGRSVAQTAPPAAMIANPRVNVLLMATWARADLVYQPGSLHGPASRYRP